jgi:uncharacterized membrane protein
MSQTTSTPQMQATPLQRSLRDRIRMALAFEIIGLLLLVPVTTYLLDKPLLHLGGLAVIMSLLATWWNYQFNLWFDRYYLIPRGRWQKTLGERVWHALAFEAGLLLLFLPLTAWLLAISLWQALLLDLAFMLFYLVYGYLYHWGYDRVFPLAASPPTDPAAKP